jgi:hypothetical protein
VLAGEVQWGNVAEWVGAISEFVAAFGTTGALVIALVVLLRDQGKAERAQVDAVGAWGEPTYERWGRADALVEDAEIRICVRNGSPLPVNVTQLIHTINTSWWMPGTSYEWDRGALGCYFLYDFRVPPNETWDATFPVKLAPTCRRGAAASCPL